MSSYQRKLNDLLDEVYDEAEVLNLSHGDLASASGLSPMTVWRLAHRVTRYPRLQTVYLLGQAVGMDLSIEKVHKQARKIPA